MLCLSGGKPPNTTKKSKVSGNKRKPCYKERKMADTISQRNGCWIQYQLKLNNYTQSTVSREANCSSDTVSHFLRGDKDSRRVRLALCKVLGYESFEKLLATAHRQEGGTA
jgi:hypothetical protein